MTTNWSKANGPASRNLVPGTWRRPPGLSLIGLALVGMIQVGCASDGCSTCGIGSAFSNGVRAVGNSVKSVGSIFHHKKSCGGGGDCGCGGGGGAIEEGVVVEPGMPMVPGGMVMPPASGTIVPPPAIESEPLNLKALPDQPASPTSGTGTTGTGSGASTPKSTTSRSTPTNTTRPNYTTSLPRNGTASRRFADADQSLAKSSGRPTDSSGTVELFENIAPVDLPSEVTRKAMTTPASTSNSNPSASTSSPTSVAPGPAEKVSAADGVSIVLPPIDSGSTNRAPGLRRYASVAPAVSGGSAPSLEGLDWLKDKGCRTFLDLRKSAEVEPNFSEAVSDRGMVYISLPILANRLDPTRLARFEDLISRSENRPVFFCDSDGSRAALVWYIHERTVGHEDPQGALSKTEELGLGASEIKLAEDFLTNQKPKARSAINKVALASPLANPASASSSPESPPALPEAPDPPARQPLPILPPAPLDQMPPAMLPGEDRPQASRGFKSFYQDPAAWKPVAALVFTGIGVPLAFWSRTMFTEYRQVRRRASLTGSKPRSLESPAGSDA